MGSLNCKCETEEDKAVIIESIGKHKTFDSKLAPLAKPRFNEIILDYKEELDSLVKIV